MLVITRRQMAAPTYSRAQVAELLSCHPDSLGRLFDKGLGSAVIAWGGHSKPMVFSTVLVLRWVGAWKCSTPRDGRRCHACWSIFEDCAILAPHLREQRHGILETCGDEDCVVPSRLGTPCGWIW
jgi:hypothetical protein